MVALLAACSDSDADLTRPTADRALNALLASPAHSAADLAVVAAEYGEVVEATGDLYEGGAELVLRVTGEGEIGSGLGSQDGVVHHCYRLSVEVDLESETSADSIERTDCPS